MSEAAIGPDKPSLSDLLRSILAQEDLDSSYIIANAINLYYESIRRRGNRNFIGPEDITPIFQIIRTYLDAAALEQGIREMTGAPRRRKQEPVTP